MRSVFFFYPVFALGLACGLLWPQPVDAFQSPQLQGPLVVSPATLELTHLREPKSIQIMGTTADGYSVDLSGKAQFSLTDAKLARLDSPWVFPLANGIGNVVVKVAGQTVEIPLKVNLPKEEPKLSFVHEVMPVLSRGGCNSGACHGYSLGKNGFKLTLRGADPIPDYFSLVREFQGRRLTIQAPEKSLVVTKATGEVAHEGGARFPKGSLSESILVNWIKQGAPDDTSDTNALLRVRMVPARLVLRPGQNHRLQLLADYTDGTTRDVTRLGIFSINNDFFAQVSELGLVSAQERGETAVVARFERSFASTGVLVLDAGKGFTPSPAPTHLIDKAIVEKLNQLKIQPSGLATDEEFLRRLHVDLIGIQPTPDEVRSFLASRDKQKREKTIDALFERPEFVDQWSLKWGDLLQNSRNSASSPGVYLFREYIRSAVASNLRIDEFAKQLLTARGGFQEDPANVFFTISKDTNETVERVTQVFCGVRMLCARCHPHPLENWTQADYFGLASFFSQVSTPQDSRLQNVPNAKMTRLNLKTGFSTNPRTGKLQPPKFLGGDEPKLATTVDRREAYAIWLVGPANPFFAKSIVNRFWSYFFHRGIIDPVDDIRSTNPPVNPVLLNALTRQFADNGFDMRKLMRLVVTSEAYQRSSMANEFNKTDEQNFSRMIPRRIPAEALMDGLIQATAVQENFAGAPGGFRAAQLPDGNIENPLLKLFGKPQRMDACECERDNSSNMLQALHFINGKTITGKLQNPAARPALLLRDKKSDPELVAELFLWCLARHPSLQEAQASLAFLNSTPADKRAEAVQDLMWALLNSKDFQMLR